MTLSIDTQHYSIEYNYADCRYAERRYAECRYAECRYAECHYAECRGTLEMCCTIAIPLAPTLLLMSMACQKISFSFTSPSLGNEHGIFLSFHLFSHNLPLSQSRSLFPSIF